MKEFDIGVGWMEVEVDIRSWIAEGVNLTSGVGWMDGWMEELDIWSWTDDGV
jgi:hypothetical protein